MEVGPALRVEFAVDSSTSVLTHLHCCPLISVSFVLNFSTQP